MPTPHTSDSLDILLAHNAWANRIILDLCRPLSREQFNRSFPMGPGSLHNTLTHIISAMRRWADRIAGRQLRPSLEFRAPGNPPTADPRERTLAELAELHDEAAANLAAIAAELRSDLTPLVRMEYEGRHYTFTRGAALTHVLVHGTHHRAQCLNMLRQLNVPGLSDKLPDIDICDWQHTTECV